MKMCFFHKSCIFLDFPLVVFFASWILLLLIFTFLAIMSVMLVLSDRNRHNLLILGYLEFRSQKQIYGCFGSIFFTLIFYKKVYKALASSLKSEVKKWALLKSHNYCHCLKRYCVQKCTVFCSSLHIIKVCFKRKWFAVLVETVNLNKHAKHWNKKAPLSE